MIFFVFVELLSPTLPPPSIDKLTLPRCQDIRRLFSKLQSQNCQCTALMSDVMAHTTQHIHAHTQTDTHTHAHTHTHTHARARTKSTAKNSNLSKNHDNSDSPKPLVTLSRYHRANCLTNRRGVVVFEMLIRLQPICHSLGLINQMLWLIILTQRRDLGIDCGNKVSGLIRTVANHLKKKVMV